MKRITQEDAIQIRTACKILQLATNLGEHLCQGGVNPDAIESWLDLFASETDNPKAAMVVIERHWPKGTADNRYPKFVASTHLLAAIQEVEAEDLPALDSRVRRRQPHRLIKRVAHRGRVEGPKEVQP